MVYRAKVTKILSWVESHYYLRDYPLVLDDSNVYLEVNSQEEAEFVEAINKKQEELISLMEEWRKRF